MAYTILKLAKLAGVSTRTLRYYDEIDLLKPARINASGYRIYSSTEVNRLQQILFYKELDIPLDEIKSILSAKDFDFTDALRAHRERLLEKKLHLERLIENVDKSIAFSEGRLNMTDLEKFEGFKQKIVSDNESKYGREIREKYGDPIIDASNDKFLSRNAQEHSQIIALEKEFTQMLARAFKEGDPSSRTAQNAADLHRQWLCHFWPEGQYTKAAHYELSKMYVSDQRFKAHYDKEQEGTAEFLKEAIRIYTGM
ncbi:MerR family transcriptional regulator [Fusibacter ferrireducens]|uniref:MerR family transcriptional regulator n=1 Tax=Fusibacter ferrireducens TaxID=2785058 RepID=A0ABR9ZYG3_9FIRM|nr:MerR family transcriptional regulator [Fusibacter ferrireducens]MBF4695492.1 MerR family transcriptional regulator [Fusibacter ferrireducens]